MTGPLNAPIESKFVYEVDDNGCWLWKKIIGDGGYGRLWYKGQWYQAHKAAYEVFVGPVPEDMLVCHSCDVRHCINPNHLWLGTHQDNMQDRNTKRRQAYGIRSGRSKLNPDLIRAIRSLRETTRLTYQQIADMFGIHDVTAWAICTRKTWREA